VEEHCIRLSSPFIHAGTSFAVFYAARKLYDERVGFWSAVTYLGIPGTSFSSLLITTDVPLLFFWALALWSVVEMQTSKSLRWPVLLGVSLGLGLLSKYAMLYFLLGLAIAFLPSREGRTFLAGRQMLTSLAVAVAVFSPNLIWNITNGLATVRHTASNANWNSDRLFNFSHIFEFLGAQAGIIGPIAAGIFVVGLIRNGRAATISASDRLMLALSAPVIISRDAPGIHFKGECELGRASLCHAVHSGLRLGPARKLEKDTGSKHGLQRSSRVVSVRVGNEPRLGICDRAGKFCKEAAWMA
jgi:4-amino-4-deoxy-L-arabinose transferase-like glycosyltransferase